MWSLLVAVAYSDCCLRGLFSLRGQAGLSLAEVAAAVYVTRGYVLDGIAAANWDLAQIDLAQQDYQSALPRLRESFQIMCQLQRADGIATVGMTLGELLLAAGQTDPARQVLGESLTAATKIGHPDLTRQINELLNRPVEGNEET